MNWLNLRTEILHSPEFIGCDPTRRATWLALSLWCASQENGGRIIGGRNWPDRQWQQTAGVTADEATDTCSLITIDGDDVVVWGYPLDKEAEVQERRDLARHNGRKGGRPPKKRTKKPTPEPTSVSENNQHRNQRPNQRPKAEGEGEGEGEGERNTEAQASPALLVLSADVQPGALVLPFTSPEFAAAWAQWKQHRTEIRKPLKPTATKAQLAKLADMGEARAIAAINHSLANQWTGIFEPDQQRTHATATNGRYFEGRNDYSQAGI